MLTSVESRFSVRVNKCCSRSSTRPIPNSIAEKIKKKKVSDKTLRLS